MKNPSSKSKRFQFTKKTSKLTNNFVDHPRHYTDHPSGIEAIEFCGKMEFNIGNAFKYLYRLDKKWDALEDLKKARWYIDREMFQRGTPMPINDMCSSNINQWWKADKIPDYPQADMIVKVVGTNPGNIEKALYYLWCANNDKILTWELYAARAYVNSEIRRRQRALRKAK